MFFEYWIGRRCGMRVDPLQVAPHVRVSELQPRGQEAAFGAKYRRGLRLARKAVRGSRALVENRGRLARFVQKLLGQVTRGTAEICRPPAIRLSAQNNGQRKAGVASDD
jgi:hypothetical protein